MIEITVHLDDKEISKEEKKKKKFHPFRIMGCILLPLIILGVGGYYLYHAYKQYEAKAQATIQAEINRQLIKSKQEALSSDSGDPFEQYAKQINAVIPYAQTQWKAVSVRVYNFQFDYPGNTSAIVRNSDGTEIWLLRRDGYMFRIQLFQSNDTPQQWYDSMSDKDKYSVTKVKYQKQNALYLQQIDTKASIVGDQYIVSYKGYVFQIWYQVYDPNTYPDDVRRGQYILQSIEFI